jgi:hypothetical protein
MAPDVRSRTTIEGQSKMKEATGPFVDLYLNLKLELYALIILQVLPYGILFILHIFKLAIDVSPFVQIFAASAGLKSCQNSPKELLLQNSEGLLRRNPLHLPLGSTTGDLKS